MWRSGKCATGECQKVLIEKIYTSFNENQVRDASTGIGKGFGYVNFVAIESVELALRMANQEVEDFFESLDSIVFNFRLVVVKYESLEL